MNRKSLFLLSLAVIATVLYRMAGVDFDWSLFRASLWKVQPGWFVASMLITFLTYVSRAFRWQVLLNPLKPVRIGPLFSTNLSWFHRHFRSRTRGRSDPASLAYAARTNSADGIGRNDHRGAFSRYVDARSVYSDGRSLLVDLPSKANGPLDFDEECGVDYGRRLHCRNHLSVYLSIQHRSHCSATFRSNGWARS